MSFLFDRKKKNVGDLIFKFSCRTVKVEWLRTRRGAIFSANLYRILFKILLYFRTLLQYGILVYGQFVRCEIGDGKKAAAERVVTEDDENQNSNGEAIFTF